MEDLVPIGRFGQATRLSLRALRLYDERGLLVPARVDADSGYRFYRVDQVETGRTIALLRAAGMPLEQIRDFVAAPTIDRLDAYEAALAEETDRRRRVLAYLRWSLAPKEESMFDVETKHVPDQPYVSRSTRTRVDGLERFIVGTIEELAQDDEGAGAPFVVYHGPVNEQDDGPVEVCVPSAAGDRSLPAGEVAFTAVPKSHQQFPEILEPYDAIWNWAKERGRELAGPPREIYHDDEWEIAWPLRD
jgi:DNA-binding transcriptional MerR regulator